MSRFIHSFCFNVQVGNLTFSTHPMFLQRSVYFLWDLSISLWTKISTILAIVCLGSLSFCSICNGPFHSNQLPLIFEQTNLELPFLAQQRHSCQNNNREQSWNYLSQHSHYIQCEIPKFVLKFVVWLTIAYWNSQVWSELKMKSITNFANCLSKVLWNAL